MCLEKQDLYNKFKGRVWAASANARSPMVESKYLDYLFEGKSVVKGPGGRLPVQELWLSGTAVLATLSHVPKARTATRSLASWRWLRGLLPAPAIPFTPLSSDALYLLASTTLVMNYARHFIYLFLFFMFKFSLRNNFGGAPGWPSQLGIFIRLRS